MMKKKERLEVIKELVTTEAIESQQELLDLLDERGMHLTQATISRDMNEIGIIKKGETGYYKTDLTDGVPGEMKELADSMNRKLGVTKGQAEAMKTGSMFGWKVPAADPKNYDENGKPVKPKRNKDYER